MVQKKEISFSLKINLGNYESLELAESILLDESDQDKEKQYFAELVLSVQKRIKFIVNSLGRQNDCKIFSKLLDEQKESSNIQPNQNNNKPQIPINNNVIISGKIGEEFSKNINEPTFNIDSLPSINDLIQEENTSYAKAPKGDFNSILDLEIPEI